MSKSHQLAWAAGFLDGDGFITIQTRNSIINKKQYRGLYVRVGACQASKLPLEKLQSLFGGSIIVKNSGPNRDGYNRKQQWLWSLSTQTAVDALKQMLPYLIHKKEVALLAIKFQDTVGTTKALSDDTKNIRQAIKDQIAYLNSLN